ncbi:GyrI-like domain-containing protein [Corynebacterium freiburgense]|uniref:GyrI-like domain-containing protein n=1 Tax=Corynebacterium freiburgense TaxID=556548 RepID=UPI000406E0B6|nr:GyrI-like domain-containing protein [Corynebacterium freiburgense]WJZ01807.1 Bacterial transcription activator, effector binding domain [Corynebacterium freiburgense]
MSTISQETMPAFIIASLRKIIPNYHHERTLWQEIEQLLQQSNASVKAHGMAGATFYDTDFKPSNVDVEVWVEVTEPFEAQPPLNCQKIPERPVLRAVLHGDYSLMPAIARDVDTYIEEHNLAIGPMFNIYRVGPAQNPDPKTWVTEMCFPILH